MQRGVIEHLTNVGQVQEIRQAILRYVYRKIPSKRPYPRKRPPPFFRRFVICANDQTSAPFSSAIFTASFIAFIRLTRAYDNSEYIAIQ